MGEQPKRLVEMKEACRYGQFSRSTAYTLLHDRKIDGFKQGNRVMVDLDSIDKWKRETLRPWRREEP